MMMSFCLLDFFLNYIFIYERNSQKKKVNEELN